MSKISLDNLAVDGAELSEAELGQIAGGKWMATWSKDGKPTEWAM
jgi:putative ATP-grasp target RiPP